jgi:hypothetical protein
MRHLSFLFQIVRNKFVYDGFVEMTLFMPRMLATQVLLSRLQSLNFQSASKSLPLCIETGCLNVAIRDAGLRCKLHANQRALCSVENCVRVCR